MAEYRKVMIIGRTGDSTAGILFEQIQKKLLRTVVSSPHYPVTKDVVFTTGLCPELPTETKAAAEGFVWGLQNMQNMRGGAWQVDFYSQLVFPFIVVYLE
jgi:hypothetical protein